MGMCYIVTVIFLLSLWLLGLLQPITAPMCQCVMHVLRMCDVHVLCACFTPQLYFCDLCDYSASYSQSLRLHLMHHYGFKPWKCPVCIHLTYTKQKMMRHISSRHPAANRYYLSQDYTSGLFLGIRIWWGIVTCLGGCKRARSTNLH